MGSPRAKYSSNKDDKHYHKVTKSSLAKWVSFWAAWRQRSSWAQPPGTDTAITPSCCFSCRSCRVGSNGQTPWILTHGLSVFTNLNQFSFVLRFAGHFFFCLPMISADRYFAKTCSSATSVLNDNFKNFPNFVHYRMTLHPLPGLLACLPRQALQDLVQE